MTDPTNPDPEGTEPDELDPVPTDAEGTEPDAGDATEPEADVAPAAEKPSLAKGPADDADAPKKVSTTKAPAKADEPAKAERAPKARKPAPGLAKELTPEEVAAAKATHHGLFFNLSHGLTNFNILGRWRVWFGISGAILLIGLVGLVGKGLNMGIDFTGGTVWQVAAGNAEVSDVEAAMADLGYEDVQVQEATELKDGKDTRTLRVEAEATAEASAETTEALDAASSSIDDLEPPEAAEALVNTVGVEVSDLEGPFEDDVPAPLVALQEQIDAFPKTVEDAEDKDAAATEAATTMAGLADQLTELQTAEQRRVGQSVTEELSRLTGTPEAQVEVDTVGPSWGKQISEKARNALVVFMLAITLFITIRFELKMAIATVAALFHDLLIVIGIYAVFGFPVTPATVVALLTMLGFSIYDGIVVFDRVNENTKLVGTSGKMTYTQMANKSLNQVLMRSLNTSITSLLPILAVLIAGFALGTATLEEFGLALFLGLLSGAYSSIFVATPLLAMLKEREPENREVAAKLAERQTQRKGSEGGEPALAGVGAGAGTTGVTPKPRKQGKKR